VTQLRTGGIQVLRVLLIQRDAQTLGGDGVDGLARGNMLYWNKYQRAKYFNHQCNVLELGLPNLPQQWLAEVKKLILLEVLGSVSIFWVEVVRGFPI
jgi:hypothetical protein